ncbi:MAG: hypothetical protein KF746_25745 [Chitinophagaceae bacterium]|nr:hypothetical protein [Chitinophagaceae bacterium]
MPDSIITMDLLRIPHKEKPGQLTIAKMDDAEFVNPIAKAMKDVIDGYKALQLSTYQFAFENNKPSPIGLMSIDEILRHLEWKGLKIWREYYDDIMNAELPDSIYSILNCTDKNAQEKIFKPPFQLSTLSLQKFIFKSWQLHGFTFSDYRFEHHPKGVNENDLPKGLLLNENDTVEIFGNTNLKDGVLKNVIKHRKVTIAKFLDKGSEWHCFYYNYNSINGKETVEIPHIHYISNNWTLDRNVVLNELKKRHHSFSSNVHINYKR